MIRTNALLSRDIGPESHETPAEASQHLTPGSGVCQCAACGAFFRSPSAFFRHRTGPVEARRCLTPAEMSATGMSQNTRGLWITKAFANDMARKGW